MMYRMLIADDEPIERTVMKKKIGRYFPNVFDIILAENGREAVKAFFEKECEIVILDIEMPGVSGLLAAEEIRKKNRECSIIFLTAFDEFRYAKKAFSVKALDYLLKPCVDEELVAVLEEGICLAEENKKRSKSESKRSKNEIDDLEQDRQSVQDDRTLPWEENVSIDVGQGKEIRISAVEKVISSFIEAHYMQDISLQDAAKAMNYSDAYFCRLFKLCFEKSFTTYLAEYRVEQAKKRLADVTRNVKDISGQVGYRDSNYFAKVFKRIAGVTPSEYRIQVLSSKSSIS